MQLLTTPQQLYAPYGCAICQSASYPLLDTQHEFSPYGLRIYYCRVHAKEIARVMGFVKGDEHDGLMRVREDKAALEHEHEELRADMTIALDGITRLEAEVAQAHDDTAREHQRCEQLQAQLDKVRADTTATLAATTEPEPEPGDSNGREPVLH